MATKPSSAALVKPSVARLAARVLVVATLLSAAVIHSAHIAEHYDEWKPAGVFFTILVVVEAAVAFAIVVEPRDWTYRVAAAASAATIWIWFVSRTIGIPFGPKVLRVESLDRQSAISSVMEAVTVSLSWARLRLQPGRDQGVAVSWTSAIGVTACLVPVAVLTLIAI